MADTALRLYGPAQPGTGNATLYTVPGATTCVIRHMRVMNTTGSAATISVAINGTAATAANCLLYAFSIPANSVYDWTGFIPLAAADTIQGLQGTGSALTVTIGGVEST